ncbi:MAG: methyltransferase domain-containing protein [Pseudomonadota bacterium]
MNDDMWGNYDKFKTDSEDAINFYSHVKHCLLFGLDKILTGDKVSRAIDVGCGNGDLTKLLLDYAEKVDAVDLSPTLIDKAKAKKELTDIDFHCGNFLDFESKEKYDLVTALWFHHQVSTVEDQNKIKNKITEMLTDQGRFVFLIPSAAYSGHRVIEFFRKIKFPNLIVDTYPQYDHLLYTFDKVEWADYAPWQPSCIYNLYKDDFDMDFVDVIKIMVEQGHLTDVYTTSPFDILIGRRK